MIMNLRTPILVVTLAAASLAGCVVAPLPPPRPRVVVAPPPGVIVPPGVVYVGPGYPAPAPGYVWVHHPHYGWGWRHHHNGWHRGWR